MILSFFPGGRNPETSRSLQKMPLFKPKLHLSFLHISCTLTSHLLVSSWAGVVNQQLNKAGIWKKTGKSPRANCVSENRTAMEPSCICIQHLPLLERFEIESYFCFITFRNKTSKRDMTFKDFIQGTVELKLIYNPGLSLYSGMAVTPHIKTSKYFISTALIILSASLETQHSFIQNSIPKVILHILTLLL